MKVLYSALVIALPATAVAGGWQIDESHSAARFSVRHMMVSNTTGEFKGIKGTVKLDEKNLAASSVDVTIDVTSVDTRDAKRDGHLKGADFFDTAKYPTMRFKSKKLKKNGSGWLVVGDLTIRGKTKEVTLTADVSEAVKHPFSGKMIRGISATTTINRQDFGVSWNKTMDKGGIVVGNDVKIEIDVELVKS